MRHNVGLRKLGRTSSHRRALLRNLTTSLFRHERIRTTLPKAKELRPFAEKLITLARRDDLHARRLVLRQVDDKEVVKKLFGTLGPRFAARPGGYTRILRLGPRLGDGAETALVELVGSEALFKKKKDDRSAKKERRDKAAKERAETSAPESPPEGQEPGAEPPKREKKA